MTFRVQNRNRPIALPRRLTYQHAQPQDTNHGAPRGRSERLVYRLVPAPLRKTLLSQVPCTRPCFRACNYTDKLSADEKKYRASLTGNTVPPYPHPVIHPKCLTPEANHCMAITRVGTPYGCCPNQIVYLESICSSSAPYALDCPVMVRPFPRKQDVRVRMYGMSPTKSPHTRPNLQIS